jgi:hypothetical protein
MLLRRLLILSGRLDEFAEYKSADVSAAINARQHEPSRARHESYGNVAVPAKGHRRFAI